VGEAKGWGPKRPIHFTAVGSLKDHSNHLVRLLTPLYGDRNVRTALRVSDLRLVKSYRDMRVLMRRYGAEAIYVPDGVGKRLLSMPNMTVKEEAPELKAVIVGPERPEAVPGTR
jgi:hypothetical protein